MVSPFFIFLSKGKNDTICLKEVKGQYDANNKFQQTDPGLRTRFFSGKFETNDINTARLLVLSEAFCADRIALVAVSEDGSPDKIVALTKEQNIAIAKIKAKVNSIIGKVDDDGTVDESLFETIYMSKKKAA